MEGAVLIGDRGKTRRKERRVDTVEERVGRWQKKNNGGGKEEHTVRAVIPAKLRETVLASQGTATPSPAGTQDPSAVNDREIG